MDLELADTVIYNGIQFLIKETLRLQTSTIYVKIYRCTCSRVLFDHTMQQYIIQIYVILSSFYKPIIDQCLRKKKYGETCLFSLKEWEFERKMNILGDSSPPVKHNCCTVVECDVADENTKVSPFL